MSYTREQWKSMGTKLYAEGDIEGAKYALEKMDSLDSTQAQANESGLSAEDQELFGSTTDSPLFGDGRMNQFVTGMGRGATNIGEGAKDLYMRTQGVGAPGGRTVEQEDRLDKFNRKADEERALYERGFGDSGWATAGEITGEVLPSIIPGMGIANGIRGTTLAGRTGLVAAGEGGLTEFVSKRGDLGERAVAGGIGAVTAGLADKVFGYASHKLRSNQIDNELRMTEGEKPSIRVEDSANPIGLSAEGQARKQQALDDGGYRLDAADSENESFALREREALQTQGTQEYLDMRDAQQSDVTARANKLNGEGYQYNAEMPDEASKLYLDGAEEVVGSLRNARTQAKAGVDAAYDAWRESHGSNTMIDTDGFRAVVEKEMKSIRQGQKGLNVDLKEIMEKYGIIENVEGKSSMVDRIGSMDGDFTNTMPKGQKSKPISIDTVEEIIQEINSLYKAGDGPSNRIAGEIKTRLDDWAVDSFGDISNLPATHPVRLGKEAREIARDTYKVWDDKGLLGRMTKHGVDGKSLVTNPLKSINKVLAKGNSEEVVELRKYMQGKPELSAAWDNMANAKRMELTAAALKANRNEFSHKAYFAAMDKMDYKTREALWGKEGADEMERTVRAWGLRNQKPETGATLNNSGSAASISGAQQIAGLGVAGYFGIPLQMLAPAMRILKGHSKNHAFEAAAKALNNGSLPPAAVKKARLELRQKIADRLEGVDAQRDKNYLDALILNLESGGDQQLKDAGQAATRATARVLSTSDEEDNARAKRANKLKAG